MRDQRPILLGTEHKPNKESLCPQRVYNLSYNKRPEHLNRQMSEGQDKSEMSLGTTVKSLKWKVPEQPQLL